jgi:hypothetical protein
MYSDLRRGRQEGVSHLIQGGGGGAACYIWDLKIKTWLTCDKNQGVNMYNHNIEKFDVKSREQAYLATPPHPPTPITPQ